MNNSSTKAQASTQSKKDAGPVIGFELRKLRLSLADILPSREIKDPQKTIRRYATVVSSLKTVGLVEPLVVYPIKDQTGKYLLLDGHLRLHALKELKQTEVDCIISNEDEGFTYNARINRISPIQEHKMILRAVKNGVSEERIAAALNLSLKNVKTSLAMLDGIHEEAVDLLKDKPITPNAIRLLRKVTPIRQIGIAELMVSANNYTKAYVDALVLATTKDLRVKSEEPKHRDGISAEEIARLEEEMESLEHDLKAVQDTYGENMLNLTLARGYIRKLLENGKVVRFLTAHFADILHEFETIAAMEGV